MVNYAYRIENHTFHSSSIVTHIQTEKREKETPSMAELILSTLTINEGFITSSSSAEKVGSSDDLLLEILLRLPIKSLLQFKSVSKRWRSIISDRQFSKRWRPTSSPSGMFLHWFSIVYASLPHIDFIPLDNNNTNSTHEYPNLLFFPYLYGITFMNSTNGLVSCVVCSKLNPRVTYHVINPSTRQFTTLPQPSLSNFQLEGLTMAFDPSKSPHYKLVSVRSNPLSTTHYHLEIYSSETRSWNAFDEMFTTPNLHPSFHRGVYWNGAIVWFVSCGESIFFQVEEQRIGRIPELKFEMGFWYDRKFCVGESKDRLYLAESYILKTEVKVYEMERDFSGWVMKYKIDLCKVGKMFPLIMERMQGSSSHYSFDVLSVVLMDDDDDDNNNSPFLVVTIPEKLIRFNLEEENFVVICDVDTDYCDREEVYHKCTRYFSAHSHHYIQSLFTTSP